MTDQPKLQSDLAWALAQAIEPRLDELERNQMYITLGAGETNETIAEFLRIALDRSITLTPEVVADVESWLDGYAGTDEEAELRALIDKLCAAVPPSEQQRCVPWRDRTPTATAADMFPRRKVTEK
jgi:hypothetical protein